MKFSDVSLGFSRKGYKFAYVVCNKTYSQNNYYLLTKDNVEVLRCKKLDDERLLKLIMLI